MSNRGYRMAGRKKMMQLLFDISKKTFKLIINPIYDGQEVLPGISLDFMESKLETLLIFPMTNHCM